MRQRVGRVLVALAAVAAVGSLATVSAGAGQRASEPPPGYCAYGDPGCEPDPVRRTPNGPVPRTSDGKPDLTGAWDAPRLYASNVIEEHAGGFGLQAGRSLITDPSDGIIPYQPWALAERDRRRLTENAYEDPEGNCMLSGVPRILLFDFSLYQHPDSIMLLFAYNNTNRIIPLDGRPHISDKIRLDMGDPRGRWEGDALVVDTTNFSNLVWFGLGGDFFSENAELVERFLLQDADTLAYEATITDPTAFTSPWTLRYGPYRRVDASDREHVENSCHEGNVDLARLMTLHDAAQQQGR